MLAALFLTAMAQATPVEAPDYEIIRRTSLEYIPSDIAPAIIPYGDCVAERMNEEAGDGLATGAAILSAQTRAVEHCKAERAISREKALTLLSGPSAASSSQIAHVENALNTIEHRMDRSARYLDEVNAKARTK